MPCSAQTLFPDPSAKASTQAIHPSDIYRWDNVLDGDGATCWGVYHSQAVGQWVEADLGMNVELKRLGISTGCSGKRNKDLCARPKKILVTAGEREFSALLKDSPDRQYVDLGVSTDSVRIQILDVYPLNGTDDVPLVCVADLEFVLDGGVRYVYRAAPKAAGPNEVKLENGLVLTASSKLFSAGSTGYGPDMLVDGDPQTPWAEGEQDEGAGTWAQINFPATGTIDSLTIHNGFQQRRAFRKHNRVKTLELGFSDGSSREISLKDTSKPQTVPLDGVKTDFVRLVVRDVYWANPVRHNGDTGIGEVEFTFAPGGDPLEMYRQSMAEAAAEVIPSTPSPAESQGTTQAAAKLAPTGKKASGPETSVFEKTDLEKADQDPNSPYSDKVETVEVEDGGVKAGPAADAAESGSDETRAGTAASADAEGGASSGDRTSGAITSGVEGIAESDKAGAEGKATATTSKKLPVDTRAEAFLQPVRDYYLKLLTLDEGFPELFSRRRYDEELFTFEHFKAIQRQMGTEEKLKNSVVDVSKLRFRPRSLTRDRAKVDVKGMYSVYAGTAFVEQEEDAVFTLVWERNRWKIDAKEDFMK